MVPAICISPFPVLSQMNANISMDGVIADKVVMGLLGMGSCLKEYLSKKEEQDK